MSHLLRSVLLLGPVRLNPHVKVGEVSSITVEKYSRKPQTVQAVLVTSENLDLVAEWCGGIVTEPLESMADQRTFVKVPVKSPFNLKQTMAYPGDRVVMVGRKNFKVFTEKAFTDSFERVQV